MTMKTIPDLFRRRRGRETGHWRVGDETSRTVYVDSGDIVFASSNFQADKLTTILVENGKLTQEQMDHALTNLKPGMSIGKNLIEMGFITQKDLLNAAHLQVERIVLSAMASPDAPHFDTLDELDDGIVRLPLNTPLLLLKGMLGITDRESILELLGPLNQVVHLQGKQVFELELPPDLAKIASLMDGTHTIMELSSEAGGEPMRTGTFALFLREMGWGKLYELPPLDRQALSKALDVPDPTKPPASMPSPRSTLFNLIEDAAKPTVTLEHLSKILDSIPSAEELNQESEPHYEPEPVQQEPMTPEPEIGLPSDKPDPRPVGRVLQTPGIEPEEPPLPEPRIVISHDDSDSDEDEAEDSAHPPRIRSGAVKTTVRILIWIAVAVVLAAGGYLGYLAFRLKTPVVEPPFVLEPDDLSPPTEEDTSTESPKTVEPKPEVPISGDTPKPPPVAVEPAQTSQTPSTSQPQPSRPVAAEKVIITKAARFAAIADGNTNTAQAQGKAFQDTLPKTNWTIRLVVACQGETLQNFTSALGTARPDLFLTSYRLRDGRQCYQLFMGNYSNKNAAETEIRKLPAFFKEGGHTPKIMQINEIATAQ